MKKKELLCLVFVLVLACFFRLWKLDSIPPGLYPDVAINGNEAFESLKTGNFKVFYPENNGREGLFMWLIALSFSIFGASVWSIKIVAAFCGILTVFGLYLFTKELFRNIKNGTLIALLSSFFLATSFWHTNFSRIGFRAILMPLILVFGFYFLLKGLRKKEILNFIISGILFGLGFYTYISFRFIVILLPLILFPWWLRYRKQNLKKVFIFNISCFLAATFIVALPIGIYFLKNPQDFVGRATSVSIFTTKNPAKELCKSFILHLGMFNFYGDSNWRHNISGSPILFWPVGILFLIGFCYSTKEIISKKSLAISHWSLVIWFFTMLLPGILTFEGIPHALRCIGSICPTFIFSGIGGALLFEIIKKRILLLKRGLFRSLMIFNLFLLFFSFILAQYFRYFELWAKNPKVKDAFSENLLNIGKYLNSLPESTQKYVIVNLSGVPVPYPHGIPMPAQTPQFIETTKFGKPRAVYLLPENLDKIKIISEKDVVILPMISDGKLLAQLLQKFPQGEIKEKNGILIYEIK